MNPIWVIRLAATTLVFLLPLAAYSAEAAHGKASTESAALSAKDFAEIGERIRQTGAQMRADLKAARGRLDALKAQQEAQRKQEAEHAHKLALAPANKSGKQAQPKEAAGQAQARLAAERAREARLEAAYAELKVNEDKLAAKERAAKALSEARQSAGVKAFADSSQ